MSEVLEAARRVAVSCVVVLLFGSAARGQPDLAAAAFSQWAADRAPQRGAVHAVYDAVRSNHVLIVGYDAQSGAWYKAFRGKVFGRDVVGVGFGTRAPNGPVEVWKDAPAPSVSDSAVEDSFPFVILRDIGNRAATSESILRRNDGGWDVRFEFPKGLREFQSGWFPIGTDETPKPVIYEINSEGRVEAIDRPGWGGRVSFSYDDRSPFTHPVATSLQNGAWKLRTVRFESRPAPSAFKPDAVVTKASELGAYGVGFRAVIVDPDDAHPSVPEGASVIPSRAPAGRAVHVPLCVTGLAVVCAGVYAWFRRQ